MGALRSGAEGSSEGRDRARRLALWAPGLALALATVALSFQKLRSFDYWWHLRTGAWIASHGEVPTRDPYTFSVPGSPWIDIHWLFQLALHGVHSLGGHTGVGVAKIALALALVACLATVGAGRGRPWLSAAALGFMLAIAGDRFMPRPELPTFLFLAGVLALLERYQRRPDAWVYGVVPIQLLWVNVHGLFALGLAVCAIHAVGELLRPLVLPGAGLRRERVQRLLGVTAAAAVVSLVNPNGLDGALYPLQQLSMVGSAEDRGLFGSVISELIPPLESRAAMTPWALGLFAALAGLSCLAMALNWRRLPASDPLLWVAFGYLALGARRNLALFAIVAAVLLIRNANDFLDARAGALRAGSRGGLVAGVAVAALLLALAFDAGTGRFYPRVGATREPGFGVMSLLQPHAAVDWIDLHRPPGPICHDMADGGYLIYRLFPSYRVLVDGRLEVFGSERFASLQILSPESFRRVDEEFHCGTVLLHYSLVDFESLLAWLRLNSSWVLTFVDDVAAVFVRASDDAALRFGTVDLDAPGVFPPFPEERGVEDRLRRQARTSFLAAMKRPDAALALWRETLSRYPDLPQADIVHAALLYRAGHASAAEAILRRLLAEAPDDPGRHAQVGDLRLEAGDRDAARALYDAALDLDPGFRYALLRRGWVAELDGDPSLAARLYLRAALRSTGLDATAVLASQRLQLLEARSPR